MSLAVGAGVKLALAYHHRKLWSELAANAREPDVAQGRVLQEILTKHEATSFGRDHGFAAIRTPADYVNAVGVQDYEMLRPYVQEQQQTGVAALSSEAPVLFARTSGTTGQPKDIPITATGLRRQAKAQRLLASMVSRHSNIFAGRVLTIGSPTIEGHLPSGTPYGSASGLIIDGMPNMIKRRYLLPKEVAAIPDHDERYRRIALEALNEPDVTALATANPSTLLRVNDVLTEHWDLLLAEVSQRNPRRAQHLSGLRTTDRNFGNLWPGLQVVTTWTAGSCGIALDRLRPLLPAKTKIVELGYTASEFRGTVTLAPGKADGVPLLGDVYYEFVARDQWEEGNEEFQSLGSLDVGQQYYVFVTTVDGLYRYDMNDIVEVVGTWHATPTLVFVQKGRGVTTITGEKLYESQLVQALRAAGNGSIPGAGFFLALADRQTNEYHLYIEGPLNSSGSALTSETLASKLDDQLSAMNIEYRAKRQSRRLGPLVVHELPPGAGERHRQVCLAHGQREAQFKVLHLQYRDECRVPIDVLMDTVSA